MKWRVIFATVLSTVLFCGCAGKSESATEVAGAMFAYESMEEGVEEVEEAEEESSVRVVSQRDLTGSGDSGGSSVTYIAEGEIVSLYAEKARFSNAAKFEGDWQRVELESDSAGDIRITDQNKEGFSFEGFFVYAMNTGDCKGTAYFVSSDTAIACIDEASETYVAFHKVGGTLYISHIGDISTMDMDVTPDGEYIKS